MHLLPALALLGQLAALAPPGEIVVEGTVFSDRDGDGVFSDADAPLAGVVVAWETLRFTHTDARGRYQLSIPYPGIVWARSPGGHTPAPAWTLASAPGQHDLPVPLVGNSD